MRIVTPRFTTIDRARARRHRQGDRPGASRPWVPAVAAGLCALIGALDVADALTPGYVDRVRWLAGYLPGTLSHAAVAATMVTGVLLLLLSHGLRRRKRRAWVAVVGLLALSPKFRDLRAVICL